MLSDDVVPTGQRCGRAVPDFPDAREPGVRAGENVPSEFQGAASISGALARGVAYFDGAGLLGPLLVLAAYVAGGLERNEFAARRSRTSDEASNTNQ